MKIVIISDIHDNLINLKKCLVWCGKNKIQELICCGDITNSETLEYIAKNFVGIIYLVKGNIEIYDEQELGKYDNIKYYGRIGKINIAGRKIGFCHEPFLIDKIINNNHGAPDIIFYGHTHRPWIENKNNAQLINPGTLAGVFQKATFAVWNTKSGGIELKIL